MSHDYSIPFETLGRDQQILRMQETAANLAYWKAQDERERRHVFGACFPQPKEGMNNLELGGGWLLKADWKWNYSVAKESKVDPKTGTAKIGYKEALGVFAAASPKHAFIADRLITFDPKLSLKEWKELTPEEQHVFKDTVTISHGMPTLSVVDPNAPKK